MEQKIKNFDRGIEQMMNEHEVAPPFGMWNRISSELEAMPVAAAAAPVVTSLIPKRAIVGIIAAALVIGATVITGYLVNSSLNSKGVNTQIAASVQPVHVSHVQQQTQAVKNDVTPLAKAKVSAMHNVAVTPVQSTLQVAQQVKPVINQQVTAISDVNANNTSLAISNASTDVPTPIEPIAQNTEAQTYYFPPIDVNTPEKVKTESESTVTVKKPVLTAAVTEADKDDRGGVSKFKFRMHNKKKKFTYGNIIK